MIFGKGGIIALAGFLLLFYSNENSPQSSFPLEIAAKAWSEIIFGIAILIAIFALVHFLILPKPISDVPAARERQNSVFKNFATTWKTFFEKKQIALLLAFLLLYRLGEVQIATVSTLFFKDVPELGGLGIDNIRLGILSGTIGTSALLLGGIIAGILVTLRGLKFWFWPMLIFLNLPDLIYVAFAHFQPSGTLALGAGIAIEQFGYGFGFSGYMLYMLFSCSTGTNKVAHYAICSGIMALGAMLPRIWTGTLLEKFGYENFFWWAILCSVPAIFVVAKILKTLPEDFGKKSS